MGKSSVIYYLSFLICILLFTSGCSKAESVIRENTAKREALFSPLILKEEVLVGDTANGTLIAWCYNTKDSVYGIWLETLTSEVNTMWSGSLVSISQKGIDKQKEIYHFQLEEPISMLGLITNQQDNLVTIKEGAIRSQYSFCEYSPEFDLIKETKIDEALLQKIGSQIESWEWDGSFYYLFGAFGVLRFDHQFEQGTFLQIEGLKDKRIEAAKIGKDGLLYFFASNQLFVLDAKVDKLIKSIDISIENRLYELFSGNETFPLVGLAEQELIGISADGKVTLLISLLQEGLTPSQFYGSKLSEEGLIYFEHVRGQNPQESKLLKVSVQLIPYEEVQQRQVITLSSSVELPGDLKEAIVAFNQSNKDNVVKVEYIDEDEHTFMSQSLGDLIIPPVDQSNNYKIKGVFEDLYPYIDAAKNLSRSDFFPQALQCMETTGALYGIWNCFFIEGYSVYTEMAPNTSGFSYNWFLETLEKSPNKYVYAEFPETSKTEVLKNLIKNNYNDFVDSQLGVCNFQGSEIKEAIEIADKFNEKQVSEEELFNYQRRFKEGNGVLQDYKLRSVEDYIALREVYLGGLGQIDLIGNPSPDGQLIQYLDGNEICINSASANKEGAWSFIQFWLTYTSSFLDRPMASYGFPVLIELFNSKMEKVLYNQDTTTSVEITIGEGMTYKLPPPTKEDYEQIKRLIQDGKPKSEFPQEVIEIILEEAQLYFDKVKPLDEVLMQIQSRCQIYVDEQK